MALTGVDPTNPRPAIRREFIFGAGPSLGQAPNRPILIVANRTSAGSETLDVVDQDLPIESDADCRTRFGARSELYAMYRQIAAVPQDSMIYGIAATESAGAASSVEFTVSTTSDASTTWEFHCHGETFTYSAIATDTVTITAQGIAAAFTGHDEGRLQVTAIAAIDGAGPDWKITVTAAQTGPRGTQIIGAIATRGLRVRIASGTGNAQTVVKNVGSHVAGGAEDDHSAAIANIQNGEWYYQVTAKTATVALTTSDNGLGEHMTMLKAEALPITGKDQQLHAAVVSDQSDATDVATSSPANSTQLRIFHQENSDWSNAMLAAHCMAVARQQEMKHPGANINQWTAADGQVFNVPKPYLVADHPTSAEIVADLNNGVSPIVYEGNRVSLDRLVLSRSLNSLGSQDYRAREGHIYSAITFVWAIARQRYESIRQPFADADPVGNNPPPKGHTTPSDIVTMWETLIDDMTSDNPLGTYDKAILKPSANQAMKDSIVVTYNGGGGFPARVELQAVQHNIKYETEIAEVGAAY